MIHSSLSALNKVLKGVTLLSSAVHKLASSLMKHDVKHYNYTHGSYVLPVYLVKVLHHMYVMGKILVNMLFTNYVLVVIN